MGDTATLGWWFVGSENRPTGLPLRRFFFEIYLSIIIFF